MMRLIASLLICLNIFFFTDKVVRADSFWDHYARVSIIELRQMQTRKFKINPKWKLDLNYGNYGYSLIFEEAAKDICGTGAVAPGCGPKYDGFIRFVNFEKIEKRGNYIYVRISMRDYFDFQEHPITKPELYDAIFSNLADALFVQALEISPAEIK